MTFTTEKVAGLAEARTGVCRPLLSSGFSIRSLIRNSQHNGDLGDGRDLAQIYVMFRMRLTRVNVEP